MEIQILLSIIIILGIKWSVSLPLKKKFVHQRDMSEYCRRRVVPSVFLGREVTESSADVMHFSRLETPYSCSISIRTESGSNVLLVIHLRSHQTLIESCKINHDQLLVYEMGETFGGYWGALPEFLLRQNNGNDLTFYTLKTMYPTTGPSDKGLAEKLNVNLGVIKESLLPDYQKVGNYIMMEVPLVNMSGNLEVGVATSPTNDDDDLFDLIYDVTPRNEVLYETSVMPLVQFSIWRQNGERHDGLNDLQPRYKLDYSMQRFTPDYRLMFKTKNYRRTFSNRRYISTKLRKKSKELFAVNHRNTDHKNHEVAVNTHFKITMRSKNFTGILTTKILNYNDNYTEKWGFTEKYLKTLSNNVTRNSRTFTYSEMDYNVSKESSSSTTKIITFKTDNLISYEMTRSPTITPAIKINLLLQRDNTTSTVIKQQLYNLSDTVSLTKLNQRVLHNPSLETAQNYIDITVKPISNHKLNYTVVFVNTLPSDKGTKHLQSTTVLSLQLGDVKKTSPVNVRKSQVESLVDHESWENVVKVAPAIAELLNVTMPTDEKKITFKTSNSVSLSQKRDGKEIDREKRYIQAISIEESRPLNLNTEQDKGTPLEKSAYFDSRDLAEVVELQDDEIQGRVALNYVRHYVGSAVFNICDYREANARHVYLFNSSRIVLVIDNFTMDRMSIVMTETRVPAQQAVCPAAHVECQVSGVRVCVHTLNACDGVPNCGAYDIYDEDRLLCGANVGFNYTVCLAACTFIVVLLTVMYSVHYWLRRCVPKVSEAFFVYTDKSENVLYLDTIMRSPTDLDVNSQMIYDRSFYETNVLSTDLRNENRNNFFSAMRRCFSFLLCIKRKPNVSEEIAQLDFASNNYPEFKGTFSFTERELRVITQQNASIQTGDSLEMSYLEKNRTSIDTDALIRDFNKRSVNERIFTRKESHIELNTLRLLRTISASLHSSSYSDESKELQKKIVTLEEVELQSTNYDRLGEDLSPRRIIMTRGSKMNLRPPEPKAHLPKHLRFEEGTTIPLYDEHSSDEGEHSKRRGVVLGYNRHNNSNVTSSVEKYEVDAIRTGKDFRRFWGGGKGKKSTKTNPK